MPDHDPCALHIPHKRWAYQAKRTDARYEEGNYLYLEQWSRRFRDCFPAAEAEPPPFEPVILSDGASPFTYAIPGSTPLDEFEPIRYQNPTFDLYAAPGVTYSTWDGFPVGALDEISFFHVPPAINLTFEINFWFMEVDSAAPTDPATRELWLAVGSDTVNYVNIVEPFSGTRYGPIQAQIIAGPYDILEPFSIFTGCKWVSLGLPSYPPGSSPQNGLAGVYGPPPWPIIVTGNLLESP